jgi:hypothetical protein
MALNSNALVELAPTKIYLGIPSAETSQDDLVEGFINSCSTLCEKYCNRIFRQVEHTERFNGVGITEILLSHWPISSVTSVHVDEQRAFGAENLLDPSNYEIFADEAGENFILERFDAIFARGRKNVKVVYVSGYDTFDDVPDDLQLACKICIGFYYEQQQQKNWTFSNKSKGDENITLVQGIPESARVILDNYKRAEMIAPVEPVRNL